MNTKEKEDETAKHQRRRSFCGTRQSSNDVSSIRSSKAVAGSVSK